MSISSIDIDVFYNIQSTTRANTEVEAVIKACEWILNNKDRKWVYWIKPKSRG